MRKMIIIVSSQGIWVLDNVLKMVKNNLVTKLLFFRLYIYRGQFVNSWGVLTDIHQKQYNVSRENKNASKINNKYILRN